MPETEVETPAAPPANETVKEEAVKADETKEEKKDEEKTGEETKESKPEKAKKEKSPRNLLHHLPPPSIKRISKKMLFMCINSIGLLRFPPSALPVSNSKLGLSSTVSNLR